MIEQIKIQLWNQHSLLYWLTIYGAIIVNSEKWYVIVYCLVVLSVHSTTKKSMLYVIHSHFTIIYLAKWLLNNMKIGLCPSNPIQFCLSDQFVPFNVCIISSMCLRCETSTTAILNHRAGGFTVLEYRENSPFVSHLYYTSYFGIFYCFFYVILNLNIVLWLSAPSPLLFVVSS